MAHARGQMVTSDGGTDLMHSTLALDLSAAVSDAPKHLDMVAVQSWLLSVCLFKYL